MNLAWRYRRELTSTLAIVLVPSLVVSMLVRIALTGDRAGIVNGFLLLPDRADATRWIDLWIAAFGWIWALAAGVIVMVGAGRGTPTCPTAAVRQALRSLFPIVLTLGLTGGAVALLLAVTAGFAPLFLIALLVGVVVVARALLVIPVTALDLDNFWGLSRGKATRTTLWVAGGVVLPLFGLGWAGRAVQGMLTNGWLGSSVLLGFFAYLVATVVSITIVAIQAVSIAALFLTLVKDTVATDTQLARLGTAQLMPRWRTALAAGLTVPALIATGVAVAGPYDRPTVRVNTINLDSELIAVGWPAGQHPLIVTEQGFFDCQDSGCHAYELRRPQLESAMWQGGDWVYSSKRGNSTVTDKGAILSGAARTNGTIVVIKCNRTGECQSGTVTGPEPGLSHELGFAEDTDGSIFIASARDLPSQPNMVELSLIRCADIGCANPHRTVLGPVDGSVAQTVQMGRPKTPIVQLGLESDQRQRIRLTLKGFTRSATCEPGICSNPRLEEGSHNGVPAAALTKAPGRAARLNGNLVMFDCGNTACKPQTLGECCLNGQPTPLAIAAGATGLYAAISQPGAEKPGFRLTIGKPRGDKRQHQIVLWHCPDVFCAAPIRIPLHLTGEAPRAAMIAFGPDGRILLVIQGETDYAVTLTPNR